MGRLQPVSGSGVANGYCRPTPAAGGANADFRRAAILRNVILPRLQHNIELRRNQLRTSSLQRSDTIPEKCASANGRQSRSRRTGPLSTQNMGGPLVHNLAPELWVVDRLFKLPVVKAEVGTRMTIVGLRDRGLLLHSPVKLELKLRQALDELGEVRAIVAPSRVHHLFVADYLAAYRQAKSYAPPGLETKRSDLRFDGVLTDIPPELWRGQLEQHVFRGAPVLNEVIFFHPVSRTVIFTDLVFNLPASVRRSAPMFFWLLDAPGKFGPHRLIRARAIRDRAAARQSVDRILEWDFERVIVSHGDVVNAGGRERVASAFAYL